MSDASRYAEFMSEGLWDDRLDDEDREPVTPLQAVLQRCTHLAAMLDGRETCDMCNASLTQKAVKVVMCILPDEPSQDDEDAWSGGFAENH